MTAEFVDNNQARHETSLPDVTELNTPGLRRSTERYPGVQSIRDVTLDHPGHGKELWNTIRREPFFRSLPATRDENPELYDKVAAVLQDCIHNGDLLLYRDGVSIHDARPGEMQIVLSGDLQMRHNRYSRQIDGLQDAGFSGPQFTSGQALASWSMAGQTNSHFAEIETNSPSLILSLSAASYERLISETLSFKELATAGTQMVASDVELLKKNGILKSYHGTDGTLLVLERQRDFSKRSDENTEQYESCKAIWDSLSLRDHDFLVFQDNQWTVYDHKIQAGIKSSTLAQHILQKNFIYGTEELDRNDPPPVADAFHHGINNDEFLSLSRNLTPWPSHSLRTDTPSASNLFLVTFQTEDLERPEHPLKEASKEFSSTLSITIQESPGRSPVVIEREIPSHGVIDPHVLLEELIDEVPLSEHAKITDLQVNDRDGLTLYRLDVEGYREELEHHVRYSVDEVAASMKRIGYTIDDETKAALSEACDLVEETLDELLGREYSLSLQSKREVIELLRHWIKRDTLGRRDSNPIPFDDEKLSEIKAVFNHYVNCKLITNTLDVEDLLAQSTSDQKIQLVVYTYLRENQLRELDEQSLDKLYYRDVKHVYGSTVDEEIRPLNQISYELTPLSSMEAPWAAYEPGSLVVVPDRHEDLYGMRHELKAIGILKEDGSFDFSGFAGNRMVFLGDLINRSVSPLGYGTLALAEELMLEAERYNQSHDPTVRIDMVLGNHELDLLKLDDASLHEMFPELSSYVVARKTQDTLKAMIQRGHITITQYLGDTIDQETTEKHALVSHAGMLPSFKAQMFAELKELERPGTDLELSHYLNEVLLDAIENRDFSHAVFSKSKKRGGSREFSGCIEADMGNGKRGDLAEELLGSPKEAQLQFGYQLVGHSFDSKNPNVRVFSSNNLELPGCIIVDCGDHQAFGSNPTERLKGIVIEDTTVHEFTPSLQTPEVLIFSEETVYKLYKDRADEQLQDAIKRLQAKAPAKTLFSSASH